MINKYWNCCKYLANEIRGFPAWKLFEMGEHAAVEKPLFKRVRLLKNTVTCNFLLHFERSHSYSPQKTFSVHCMFATNKGKNNRDILK